MMEDKVCIGKCKTKKGLIKSECYFSIFGIFVVLIMFNALKNYFQISSILNGIIAILTFIILVIFVTPVFGANEVLEFSNQHISYYHVKGYFLQFKEVIRIFTHSKDIADISIATINVSKVILSYVSTKEFWMRKRYRLKLTFLLKDGTTFFIFPTKIYQTEKDNYEVAFRLLERNNIEIVDKYHLRKYLVMKNYSFQKYVSSIKKDIESD